MIHADLHHPDLNIRHFIKRKLIFSYFHVRSSKKHVIRLRKKCSRFPATKSELKRCPMGYFNGKTNLEVYAEHQGFLMFV